MHLYFNEISPLSTKCEPQTPFSLSLPDDFVVKRYVVVDTPWNPNLLLVHICELVFWLNTSIKKSYMLLTPAITGLSRIEDRIFMGGVGYQSEYIDYKQCIFSIVHQLKILCDTLIMSYYIKIFKDRVIKDRKLHIMDIGTLLKDADMATFMRSKIAKDDHVIEFLKRLNDICNGLKHSFLFPEFTNTWLSDYPSICVYYVPYNNLKDSIGIYREYITNLFAHTQIFIDVFCLAYADETAYA